MNEPGAKKVIYGANEQATIGVARLLVEKAIAAAFPRFFSACKVSHDTWVIIVPKNQS